MEKYGRNHVSSVVLEEISFFRKKPNPGKAIWHWESWANQKEGLGEKPIHILHLDLSGNILTCINKGGMCHGNQAKNNNIQDDMNNKGSCLSHLHQRNKETCIMHKNEVGGYLKFCLAVKRVALNDIW